MLYFLLAAIGVVLLLPTGTKKTSEETEQPQETSARPAGDAGLSVQEEMEQRLCDALSQMDGVGAVHVVVTLESTGKKIVEKDVPTRSTTEENKKGEETGSVTSSSQDEATVYEKTQNGAETPYVVSEEYPAVRGVLVIAEGGGNPVTIQEIQEAVMALFQVGANKIKVVKCVEKLEQEMNAPEKMAETPSPKKTAGKKKKFRKNQVIITALAIMIAVAGYINYADSTLSTKEKADGTTADASTVLKDISSLDTDITDEVDAGTAGDSSRTVTETPGEAVLAGASTYMAQARIDREQIRSQNKDTLNEIINNTNLSETERQSAVQSMVEMTELVEKESATELLLEAKGFTDVVVNLTGETADIVVPMKEVTEEQRAQIEDIVTRKTGIGVENIVITPMSSAADTAAEESAQ